MKRTALFASALSLAFVALAAGCHKTEVKEEPKGPVIPPGQVWLTPEQVKEAAIETAIVEEQDVDDTILTSGRVTFDDLRVAHVFSPVNGRVTEIYAPLGSRVQKGEKLALIQSPDIGTAVSDARKAEVDLMAKEHKFRREKELMARGVGTQQDLEQSEDDFRTAKAELERARARAFLLNAGGVDSVHQTYTLVAPISGEIIMRSVNPGVEVQGQYGGNNVTELFTVGQLDQVWVIADFYEMDLARVKVGSPAVVATVAYKDRLFKGTVNWVSGMLDPTTRTAKVRLTFDNPCGDDLGKSAATPALSAGAVGPAASSATVGAPPPPATASAQHACPPCPACKGPVESHASVGLDPCRNRMLKPEMYATAQITVEQRRAIAIPRNAILRLGENTVVFVQIAEADGKVKFERIPVTVDEGEASNLLVVQHGLEKGKRIVVNGAIKLAANL